MAPERIVWWAPMIAAAGVLLAGVVGIATRFPGDPWLLLGQMVALAAAVAPGLWTARQAAGDRLWWVVTATFGWAALAPVEPWLPHATGQGFDCGRLTWIPSAVGDAYLAWIESWGYALPAMLLVAGSVTVAWRRQSWEMAAWAAVGALALAVLWMLGRPHDCD